MNAKKLVRLVLTTAAPLGFALVVLSACAGGSVDQESCASVTIGDTRLDVDHKLGSAESVTKAPNGFAVARYKSTVDGADQCCLVTFDSSADKAIAAVRPVFQKTCK